ncbi:hypothetical protein C0J52_00152 [Blattella germanica]|nr:hypothetical protein C0J52_00152 [Blattella germanica]
MLFKVYCSQVLKTRMALRLSYEPKGIIQGFKTMYKNGGVVGGLFKGYTPNIFGVIPYAGIELGVYETMKELFEVQPSGERSTIELLICGAVASFTGQIVVYPLGLVKTKMQSRDFEQYEFGDLVKYIYDNGGARGFYKGLVPSLMRVLPSVMINFLIGVKNLSQSKIRVVTFNLSYVAIHENDVQPETVCMTVVEKFANTLSSDVKSDPKKIEDEFRKFCKFLVSRDKTIDLRTVDLKKLKVRDLKKILSDWDETCEGCIEKPDFIARIEELKPQYMHQEL